MIVWMASGDARLSRRFLDRLGENEVQLQVSAVVAFEFADLQRRRRLALDESLEGIMARFAMTAIPFPAAAWTVARSLPRLHGDPVDRMLVAHALHDGLTLVTADKTVREYPVRSLW